jgi:hypothetical protein
MLLPTDGFTVLSAMCDQGRICSTQSVRGTGSPSPDHDPTCASATSGWSLPGSMAGGESRRLAETSMQWGREL